MDAAVRSSQHRSIATRRRRGAITQCPLIAVAEAVTVVFKCRRRHRWVAESRMPVDIRPQSFCNIAARRVEPIMESTLCDLSKRRRWWSGINNWPRMRTTGNSERQSQYSKCKCFAHFSILEVSASSLSCRVRVERFPIQTPIPDECCTFTEYSVPSGIC